MADVKIVVQGKARPSAFCPVSVELDVPCEQARALALLDGARGACVPFQVQERGAGCLLHWIVDAVAPGQERRYVLTDSRDPARGPGVELTEQEGDRIQVKIGAEVVTNYHYGAEIPRPVLYPIIGPFGQGVTRHYPMETVEDDHTDHPHHRSIWVAWGDVNGSDNWSELERAGKVLHTAFDGWSGGQVFGWIASRNDWVDVGGKKLMEDRMLCRFYNLPSSMRAFDFEVTLIATEGDVRFGDTKEGGVCSVRVAAPMEADRGGRIENSLGGVNEDETWGKRASWCDYCGTVGGHTVGIAVFDHPTSFRYPTYWHVRNYGLMTANPFGLSYFEAPRQVDGSHVLPAGQELAFRYRIFVHAGDAAQGAVRDKYLDWTCPPVAAVVE